MTPPVIAPAQLAFRFAIELAAFFGISAAGNVWGGYFAAAGAVVAFGVSWAVFNVKGDPSRSGRAPVAVPGAVRLGLELITLGSGVAGLAVSGRLALAAALGACIVVHYVMTRARIAWLFQQPE